MSEPAEIEPEPAEPDSEEWRSAVSAVSAKPRRREAARCVGGFVCLWGSVSLAL